MDVAGDYRFGAFGPGPAYVAGMRVEYYVPYSGEREMFRCTVSTRNLSLRPVELGNILMRWVLPRLGVPT